MSRNANSAGAKLFSVSVVGRIMKAMLVLDNLVALGFLQMDRDAVYVLHLGFES